MQALARTALAGLIVQMAGALVAAEVNGLAAVHAAAASIRFDDLKRHVATLADDTFEGREAGSRGGRAAGIYLGRHYQQHALQGGGEQGYYQSFGPNYSNILGRLDGDDPILSREVIVVSAHYDHVGYGTSQNSHGPTGYIHNGADDNASGVAGLLELIEAFAQLPAPPRRTILFALWDGEEKGLLGSKHWVSRPTVPLSDVACMVNVDMIGRLRGDTVEIIGTRTAHGFRRLIGMANRDTNLLLDCTWEMVDNSDHYPFYQRNIPVLMLHTGLHADYHRPSDDVERIEFDGMERVTRLMFQTVYALANQDTRPSYRMAARSEGLTTQQALERSPAPVPPRLGVRLERSGGLTPSVRVTSVDPHSSAERAGIVAGDELLAFAGRPISDVATLRKLIWSVTSPVTVVVRHAGAQEPTTIEVPLAGSPVRLGITWRVDEAEPGAVILTRVIPGTPAGEAGLLPNDRVYQVNGQDFADQGQFRGLLDASHGLVELLYERQGRIAQARVELSPVGEADRASL